MTNMVIDKNTELALYTCGNCGLTFDLMPLEVEGGCIYCPYCNNKIGHVQIVD